MHAPLFAMFMVAAVTGFPSKPITIVAPANPGGGWDQTARQIQQVLASQHIINVPIEVANRPGAGGTIGLAEFITTNRNDPHSILVLGRVMMGAILTNHSAVTLSETVPLARLLNEYEAIAVPANSKYQTLRELIEDFKKDPEHVSWGGGSAGGTDHILIGMLAQAAGISPKRTNYIAHSGGGEAAVAVMGGHVTAGVSGYGEWKPHVKSGRSVSSPYPHQLVSPVTTRRPFWRAALTSSWRTGEALRRHLEPTTHNEGGGLMRLKRCVVATSGSRSCVRTIGRTVFSPAGSSMYFWPTKRGVMRRP